MSCCKDKIIKITEKVNTIIQGNINLITDTISANIFNLPTERYEQAETRKIICRECDKHTWMFGKDYIKWLKDNGIEVFKNIDDLTKLPELQKQEYEKKKKLFCSVCKCWIPAKAEVEQEKCPLGKWEKES